MSTERRSPRRRTVPEQPLWQVTIAGHTVGRYAVPAQTVALGSPTAEMALKFAVQRAHIDAEIPPFRSLLRESLQHARAIEIGARR